MLTAYSCDHMSISSSRELEESRMVGCSASTDEFVMPELTEMFGGSSSCSRVEDFTGSYWDYFTAKPSPDKWLEALERTNTLLEALERTNTLLEAFERTNPCLEVFERANKWFEVFERSIKWLKVSKRAINGIESAFNAEWPHFAKQLKEVLGAVISLSKASKQDDVAARALQELLSWSSENYRRIPLSILVGLLMQSGEVTSPGVVSVRANLYSNTRSKVEELGKDPAAVLLSVTV